MTTNRAVTTLMMTLMTATLTLAFQAGCRDPETQNTTNNGASSNGASNTTGGDTTTTGGGDEQGDEGDDTPEGAMFDANKDLCERTPVDWLRDPANRFPNGNIACEAGPTGICFGMNLAELYMAYQVTFDPSRPAVNPAPDIPIHEVLSNVLTTGFENGRPVVIPGAANPAEAAQVYGSEWIAAMRDFQMKAHEKVYGDEGQEWMDSIGFDPDASEAPACDGDALRLRLNSGRPAMLLAELNADNLHSMIAISYIEPQEGPYAVILDMIDPNYPGEIVRVGCDQALTSCDHSKPTDFAGKPITDTFEGDNHNHFVDALDHLYQQQCPQRPVVRDSVYRLISSTDEGQVSSTVFNRFELDEGGIVRQLARQKLDDAQGTELLWIWEASTDTSIVYTFAPSPAPVTRTVVPYIGGEADVLPLTPGVSLYLMDCLGDDDLEGCLTAPDDARFTTIGDDDERCNACLEVEKGTHFGQGTQTTYCVPTEPGYRETLLPLRISASGGGGSATNVFDNLRVRRHTDPSMFAEPTNCQPLPGVDGVSVCN